MRRFTILFVLILLVVTVQSHGQFSLCPSPCSIGNATVTFTADGAYTLEKDTSSPPNIKLTYNQSTAYANDALLVISATAPTDLGFVEVISNGKQRIAIDVFGSDETVRFKSLRGITVKQPSGSRNTELAVLRQLYLSGDFGISTNTTGDVLHVDDVLAPSASHLNRGINIEGSSYGVWRFSDSTLTQNVYRGVWFARINMNFRGDIFAQGTLGVISNMIIDGFIDNPGNAAGRAMIQSPQGAGIWESGDTDADFDFGTGYINRFVIDGDFNGSFAGRMLFPYKNGPGNPDGFPLAEAIFQVTGDLNASVTLAKGASV